MSMFELEELRELKRLAETRLTALEEAQQKVYTTFPSVGDRLAKRAALMRSVIEKLDTALVIETKLKKKGTYEQSSEKEEES